MLHSSNWHSTLKSMNVLYDSLIPEAQTTSILTLFHWSADSLHKVEDRLLELDFLLLFSYLCIRFILEGNYKLPVLYGYGVFIQFYSRDSIIQYLLQPDTIQRISHVDNLFQAHALVIP